MPASSPPADAEPPDPAEWAAPSERVALPGNVHRVETESVHWPTVLPWLALFRSFGQALHPAKMALAFALVVLLYAGGVGLDWAMGPGVRGGEMGWPPMLSGGRAQLAGLETTRGGGAGAGGVGGAGVFEATVASETAAARYLFGRLLRLDLGVPGFYTSPIGAGGTIAGVPWHTTQPTPRARAGGVWLPLYIMFIAIPAWLYHSHPLFLGLYGAYAFVLTCFFGGAISRHGALQACRDQRPSPAAALRFAGGNYLWFVLCPLIPLGLIAAIWLLQALLGWILFNMPGTDVVGGVVYPLFLLGGLIVTLIIFGLALAIHVLFPALAVEGTDAFDALSRAYNYVLGRPWRFLFYLLVASLYFAVTFLFANAVVYGTIWWTRGAAGIWVFADNVAGANRYDQLMTQAMRVSSGSAAASGASGTIGVAAGAVAFWLRLLLLLLPAFAVSFYYTASTWIYLLLRRAADGVEDDDVYLDTDETAPTDQTGKATPAGTSHE